MEGWATIYDYEQEGRLRRLDRYKRARRTAVDDNAGVWGSCGGDLHSEQTR